MIISTIDEINPDLVRGWAYDENNIENGILATVKVDDVVIGTMLADLPRDDVYGSGFPKKHVGFEFQIPENKRDGFNHEIKISFESPNACSENPAEIAVATRNVILPRYSGKGMIDGFKNGAISGWAVLRDHLSEKIIARPELFVYVSGVIIARITANNPRPDVDDALKCGIYVGFSFRPPLKYVSSQAVAFTFKFVLSGGDLNSEPFVLNVPAMAVFDEIGKLRSEVDDLFSATWALRSRLSDLLARREHHLSDYHQWAVEYQVNLSAFGQRLVLKSSPLVTIICPTYRPDLKDFECAIESVRSQTYDNWELIIIDDKSEDAALTSRLARYSGNDMRIRVIHSDENLNISGATNLGIRSARGRYIALFDHDDMLDPNAISIMVLYAIRTNASLIYSDEDKVDEFGFFSQPNLKPDWNYRLLLSQNYICHFTMFKRELIDRNGLFRKEYDGAQDHDLFLRFSEALEDCEIVHVPEVLYHWRITPVSTASGAAAKPYAVNAGMQAVADHMNRKNVSVKVTSPTGATFYRVETYKTSRPHVSILVPFRDQADITEDCINSLIADTDYDNYDVLIINNLSNNQTVDRIGSIVSKQPRVRMLDYNNEFNYSKINNEAVKNTKGDLLLFLNNDVTMLHSSWLSTMVGELQIDPQAGAVGCNLLYPNGAIQHSGVIVGVGGVADHAFRGLQGGDPGYVARAICAQNFSAATAACLLVRRSIFELVGGFDEKDLKVAFNDVDLCLKILHSGSRIAWTPHAVAIHHESISRGNDFKPARRAAFFHENQVMEHRWKDFLADDPAYNPHFSRMSGIFDTLGEPVPTLRTIKLADSGSL